MADGSVVIDTKLDQSGLRKGLSSMAGSLLKGLGTALAGAATLVSTGVGAAVKYGNEFESAFAGVKKTVDATEEELADLRQGILDMSTEMPFAASDIASVAEAAGQLGIQTENILSFTEVMSNLGVATNLTAEEAASSLAKFANIVQMPQDEFDRLGSVIVALGNNLATTEADIVSMGMRLAGTGSQVGLSESQIMALSGALSSVGLASEAGGSAMSRVLSMMQLASEQGGAALDSLANIAGMTSDEFKRSFEEDATDALMAFLNGLKDAESQGKSAIGVIAELGNISELSAMDTVVVRDSLLRAAGASNVMADALSIADEAWDKNTALVTEASQRYETFESKVTMLSNSAKVLGVEVFDSLREPLGDLVSFATDIISDLRSAFVSGGFDELASSVGDALAKAVAKISEYGPKLIETAAVIIESLASGLADDADVIVDTLFEALMSAFEHLDSIAESLMSFASTLVISLAEGLSKNSEKITATLSSVAKSVISCLVELVPKLLPLFVDVAIGIVAALATTLIENIDDIISAGSQIVSALIEGLVGDNSYILDGAVTIITSLAQALEDNIDDILLAAENLIMVLVGALMDPDTLQTLLSAATVITATLFEALLQLIGSSFGFTESLGENIGAEIAAFDWAALGLAIINGIADGLLQIDGVQEAVDGFSEVWAIGYLEIEEFVKNVAELWQLGWDTLVEFGENVYDAIQDFKDKWNKFWTDIALKFVEKVNKFKSDVQAIPDKILEIVNGAKTWGKDLIDNFIGGIKQKWSDLVSTASNIAQTIRDYIGFSEPKKGPLSPSGGHAFHTYAPDMIDLFTSGIRDNAHRIGDEFNKSLDIGDEYEDMLNKLNAAVANNQSTVYQESLNGDVLSRNKPVKEVVPDEDTSNGRIVQQNATFNLIIDGDTVADALTEKIDMKQGETVELRKRGLSV